MKQSAALSAIALALAISGCAQPSGDASAPVAEMSGALPVPVGLNVGAKAPNIELTAPDGSRTRLSELLRDGPVVLTFYRGGWCPYCTDALAGFEQHFDDFRAQGATIAAISPEKPAEVAKTIEKTGATYKLYSDPEGKAMRDFNLVFDVDEATRELYKGYKIDVGASNASGRWELPVPATYVIDQSGTIRWTHFDPDYKQRANPEEVLAVLRTLRN